MALASGYARGIKVCGKKNVCTAFHDKKKKYPIERQDREIASAPTAPRNKPNVRTVPPTVSPYCHAIYLKTRSTIQASTQFGNPQHNPSHFLRQIRSNHPINVTDDQRESPKRLRAEHSFRPFHTYPLSFHTLLPPFHRRH